MTASLRWHDYSYFPYERDLAEREVAKLLEVSSAKADLEGLVLPTEVGRAQASRLVYFADYRADGEVTPTAQYLLEATARAGQRRQATRYSVHGLHEYKGKFNPQVAKAILNIFGVHETGTVLDPFCGSGTTLVECAHLGAQGVGFDLNPLAVFITNAKLLALRTPSEDLSGALNRLQAACSKTRKWAAETLFDERGLYLRDWFDADVLAEVELLRRMIHDAAGTLAPVFLCLASDLLRDYSQQDPADLRIRRRKSPLPETPLHDAFLRRAEAFLVRVKEAQAVIGLRDTNAWARLMSADSKAALAKPAYADAAITSPPYAMALPYIDTQRLSLIWLDLVRPDELGVLEGDLTGSRELRKTKRQFAEALAENTGGLPLEQHQLCLTMQASLSEKDGFRRRVVPTLLYRYFVHMQDSFRGVRRHMKDRAPYALIVGHNHTTLGGRRFDIDTPRHLASIAQGVGWAVEELVEMQTYQRFGYHAANAVSSETLLLLRNA